MSRVHDPDVQSTPCPCSMPLLACYADVLWKRSAGGRISGTTNGQQTADTTAVNSTDIPTTDSAPPPMAVAPISPTTDPSGSYP